jgi:hypothetical protein
MLVWSSRYLEAEPATAAKFCATGDWYGGESFCGGDGITTRHMPRRGFNEGKGYEKDAFIRLYGQGKTEESIRRIPSALSRLANMSKEVTHGKHEASLRC